MPKFKIEFNRVYEELFDEVIVEAEHELGARLLARGLVTEKQKTMSGQISAVVVPVNDGDEGKPEVGADGNGVKIPF